MNEKLYHYGGFNTKLGSFDIYYQDRLYTIECGLINANTLIYPFVPPHYKLFVAIWLNDQSPLHLGAADFICCTSTDRLRIFEHSKSFPEEFISEIEYQARRFEKLKAFL